MGVNGPEPPADSQFSLLLIQPNWPDRHSMSTKLYTALWPAAIMRENRSIQDTLDDFTDNEFCVPRTGSELRVGYESSS